MVEEPPPKRLRAGGHKYDLLMPHGIAKQEQIEYVPGTVLFGHLVKGLAQMATCYECFLVESTTKSSPLGLCEECSVLVYGDHGGKLSGQRLFGCSKCISGAVTTCIAKMDPNLNDRSEDDGPSGPAILNSLVLESLLGRLGEASRPSRAEISISDARQVWDAFFNLLDSYAAQAELLSRIDSLVRASVDDYTNDTRPEVSRRDLTPEEVEQLEAQLRKDLTGRIRRWLAGPMEAWMRSIHPELSRSRWLGQSDDSRADGAIDLALAADAIGLVAYSWHIRPDVSPFSHLETAISMPAWALVTIQLLADARSAGQLATA